MYLRRVAGRHDRQLNVNDVPQRGVTRTAKLAGLPIGYAGRTALGLGKRIGGRSAEIVAAEIQQRTAEQIFRVLGELKGGAMKLGQALSIFEAALPPEIAGPYRATLTKLQESAPPLPARTVHQVLVQDLGETGATTSPTSTTVRRRQRRSARCTRPPGATAAGSRSRSSTRARARRSSRTSPRSARVGRLFGVLMPGLDVKPLLEELRDRVVEELDYELEAEIAAGLRRRLRGRPGHLRAATW